MSDRGLLEQPSAGRENNPIADAIAAMDRAKFIPVWDRVPYALHVEIDKIFKCLIAWEKQQAETGQEPDAIVRHDADGRVYAVLRGRDNPLPDKTLLYAQPQQYIEVDGIRVDAEWVRDMRGRYDAMDIKLQRTAALHAVVRQELKP